MLVALALHILALQDLQADLKRAEAGKKGEDGKVLKEDSLRSRVEKKKLQLAKAEIAAAVSMLAGLRLPGWRTAAQQPA
jgi:hypothetical protein